MHHLSLPEIPITKIEREKKRWNQLIEVNETSKPPPPLFWKERERKDISLIM